jgi:uncharacterized UPF0146 family protein
LSAKRGLGNSERRVSGASGRDNSAVEPGDILGGIHFVSNASRRRQGEKMPRQLAVLGTAIGTKSEFTKLQISHAVVGNDSAAIGKAAEKIDKLPDSISRLADWVQPHHELDAAVKAFQSKYGSKHPKFLQAVRQSYLQPVENIIQQGKDSLESLRIIPEQLKASMEILDRVNALLATKPLNGQIVKKAMDSLTGAGTTFSQAALRASELARNFQVPALQSLAEMSNPVKDKYINPVLATLYAMIKQNNYNADLGPSLVLLKKMHETCMNAIKAL